MVMQPSQYTPIKSAHLKESHLQAVTGLPEEMAAYSSFGTLLASVRESVHLTQDEVAESLPPYFSMRNVPVIDNKMYGNLERGRRYPAFAELLPLYHALTEGCGIKFSQAERELYVVLARKKLAAKKRRIERISAEQWQQLADGIAKIDGSEHSLHVLRQAIGSNSAQSPILPGLQRAVARASRIDVSHLLERDAWIEEMLSYLEMKPAKKLVTIQAVSGAGKTSAINLLLKNLIDRDHCLPLLFSFSPAEDMTPDDHLDTFLAQLLTDLGIPQSDEAQKARSADERIEQVLNEIIAARQQGMRVILLLDDAQVILERDRDVSAHWLQFLSEFVKNDHGGTIYLTTREWPGWPGRDHTYIAETEMPRLTVDAGVVIWQRMGFEDVPEDLLRQASGRFGGNPQMIELRAASLSRPGFVYAWRSNGALSSRQNQKSGHQVFIEKLLSEETVFDTKTDIQARKVLQQVISNKLSHQAVQLLEVLSASPLPLPFPLLDTINSQAELALDELVRCSLVDRDIFVSDRVGMLPIVREAELHTLITQHRREEIEQKVQQLYETWLHAGDFQFDQEQSVPEQAMLISELAIFYLKYHQLLKAAELLVEHGWLSFTLGHGPRLARMASEVMQSFDWHRSGLGTELGGQILRYHLARFRGEKVREEERAEAYQRAFEQMMHGEIDLSPAGKVHLVHHLIRRLADLGRFEEAQQVFHQADAALVGLLHPSDSIADSITSVALLANRAYLLGRWSASPGGISTEQATSLKTECLALYRRCIAILQEERYTASHVLRSKRNFLLARYLNDSAYYQRELGDLEQARCALEDCIALKKAGYTVSRTSLAVSISEHAQVLCELGSFRLALVESVENLESIRAFIQAGHKVPEKEVAMLEVEHAHILYLLGRLEEAYHLYQNAYPRLTGLRETYKPIVRDRLTSIETQYQQNPERKLDWRWFDRYHDLVSYDSIGWFAAAGTFTDEEQREWDAVQGQPEEGARERRDALLTLSRDREITAAFAESREPHFTYPLILIEGINERLAGLQKLKNDILAQEPNALVRRFYIGAIDEHIYDLSLAKATYTQDNAAYQQYVRQLYPEPSRREMEITLQQLVQMLKRGMECAETHELSVELYTQIQQWHALSPTYVAKDGEGQHAAEPDQMIWKKVQTPAVKRLFERVFEQYQFDEWKVALDATTSHARVELDLQTVYLPAKPLTIAKVLQLLAHEIEAHVFRSSAGKKSVLALLSSGTQHSMSTDEGLAIWYETEVERRPRKSVEQIEPAKDPSKMWLGTLATGLAYGIVTKPFTFTRLYAFLEKVFFIRGILAGKASAVALADAKQMAQDRCIRTFRGVPDLTVERLCSTKDAHYLAGYLAVTQELQRGTSFEHLMAGCFALEQMADLKELNILEAAVPHQKIALTTSLESLAAQLSDE